MSNFNKRTLGNFFFPQLSNRGAVVWKSHDGLASLRSFTESTRPRKLSNNDLRTSNLGLPTSKVEPNCQLAHFLNCFTPNLVYLRHYVNHFRSWRRVQETSSWLAGCHKTLQRRGLCAAFENCRIKRTPLSQMPAESDSWTRLMWKEMEERLPNLKPQFRHHPNAAVGYVSLSFRFPAVMPTRAKWGIKHMLDAYLINNS